MDLGRRGKAALVTGGSRGIGKAIAGALLREGASVALCARNAEALAQTVDALKEIGSPVVGQFLASERAGFICGANIDVDGGHQRSIM